MMASAYPISSQVAPFARAVATFSFCSVLICVVRKVSTARFSWICVSAWILFIIGASSIRLACRWWPLVISVCSPHMMHVFGSLVLVMGQVYHTLYGLSTQLYVICG